MTARADTADPADPAGRLAARRAVVTGASSGIGEAIARALTAAGAQVVAVARRADRLTDLAEDTGAHPLVADLTDPGAPAETIARATELMGGLDLLVNNAGIMRLGRVTDGNPADWRAMFDLNVLALLETTHAAIPALRDNGFGDIVNMSSMAGRWVRDPESGVYSGTKYAVHAISEGLRQELHDDGIRVSIVSPGMTRSEIGGDTRDPQLRQGVRERQESIAIPPEAIARAVVHVVAEPREVTTPEIAVMPTRQP